MALKFGTSGIRGLNTEFTPNVVRSYIEAFVEYAKTKIQVSQIALAGDLRESTPGIQLQVDLILKSMGIQTMDCGALPTPALALYCSHKNVPGIMITGSHIPADRNGIKFYWPWGEILKEDEIQIVTRFEQKQEKYRLSPLAEANLNENSISAKNLFFERYIQFFSPFREKFKGKKVVVYQHSAVTRDLWKPVLESLGFDVVEIGRSSLFTPVDTETDEAAKNLNKMLDVQTMTHLFAVISTDGDGDRPFLCDEKLKMVRGDTIGILSAKFLKTDIVVTPVSTNTALELAGVAEKVIRTKIGSPFVIETMNLFKGDKVVVGFEANGGLLLGSSVNKNGVKLTPLPTRDSFLPILCCFALAGEKDLTLSELVDSLPSRFTDSSLIREFPMQKVKEIYQAAIEGNSFKEKFISKYGSIKERNEIDGLRLTLADESIIHFRPSGNAPEFRCYVEADSKVKAQTLVEEGILWLRSFL